MATAGAKCKVNWKNKGTYYGATIRSVNGDTFAIDFDDGDFEDNVTLDRIQLLEQPKPAEEKKEGEEAN